MDTETPWLSDAEEHLWRRWLAVNTDLLAALHRSLQADSGLSLTDFEVLVRLTDTSEGRIRVTDLARVLNWERSRVSHHVARMERRELVTRQECPNDGRGAFVVLTDHGRASIEAAAPGHVRTVRSLFFDHVSEADLALLSDVLDGLRASLDASTTGAATLSGR